MLLLLFHKLKSKMRIIHLQNLNVLLKRRVSSKICLLWSYNKRLANINKSKTKTGLVFVDVFFQKYSQYAV